MCLQARAQAQWEKLGRCQRASPSHCCYLQAAHCKANIPRSWKEAKLIPIHKKGPVTQPGNYRMIVISGTLYRLYSNLLRSMIQDWCSQHNKIPDMQYGFYPGRSTLQPIFILRLIRHAAQRMQNWSSRLNVAFIDFKQAFDCIPRHKLWGIYAVAGCLTISYPSWKACTMLMNTHYWMRIRQLPYSYLLVLNKDVPSTLCCSLSTWMT